MRRASATAAARLASAAETDRDDDPCGVGPAPVAPGLAQPATTTITAIAAAVAMKRTPGINTLIGRTHPHIGSPKRLLDDPGCGMETKVTGTSSRMLRIRGSGRAVGVALSILALSPRSRLARHSGRGVCC